MNSSQPRRASVLSGGWVILFGLIVWNAGNYAFFLIAGRSLGPSDYGLVAALLAAVIVVSIPTQGLQFAVARLIAAPPARDEKLAIGIYRRLWLRSGELAVAAGLVVSTAIALVDLVSHAVPVGPLVATVALCTPVVALFVTLGRLQGERRFTAFSVCFMLWGLLRPLCFVLLRMLGLRVYAGLAATAAATLAALSVAIWLTLDHRVGREPTKSEWRAFIRPVLAVIAGLAGLGVIISLDVIVAKIVLDPASAGQFAAAAAIAKAVFLVPQTTSAVLLPRVASRTASAQDTGTLIGLGVGVTLVIGGLASTAIWAVAEPLLRLTYGSDFVESATLLGAYAGACTLLGALIVTINHHVGRSADRFVLGMVGIAAFQALLFVRFHSSARVIVAVDAIVGLAGLLMHETMFFRTEDSIVSGLVRAVRRSDLWRAA